MEWSNWVGQGKSRYKEPLCEIVKICSPKNCIFFGLRFLICIDFQLRYFLKTAKQQDYSTDSDGYSEDRYCGNDGYSRLYPPDDAILFTVTLWFI